MGGCPAWLPRPVSHVSIVPPWRLRAVGAGPSGRRAGGLCVEPGAGSAASGRTTMDHAETLRGLLDKAAIADVIHAYCFHFDRAEPEAVVALFTEDAVVDYGPDVATLTGTDEIRTMVSHGLANFFAAT